MRPGERCKKGEDAFIRPLQWGWQAQTGAKSGGDVQGEGLLKHPISFARKRSVFSKKQKRHNPHRKENLKKRGGSRPETGPQDEKKDVCSRAAKRRS